MKIQQPWVIKMKTRKVKDSQNIFDLEETLEIDDAAKIVLTKDGYLVGMPRVARTGIQQYAGFEMDIPDKEVVNIYRPESEVFNLDSWKSFAYRPVTLDHPPEMVDASNWKKYAVGQCGGEVARDGDFIRIPMTIMDQDTIKAVKDGKVQLSVGYSSKILFEDGKAPDGQHYDAVQTNIRVNHIAVVDRARGGPKLKFGDHAKERTPAMVILDVNGISLEMEPKDASIIQAHLKTLNTQLTDAIAAAAATKTAYDTQIATLTANGKIADDAVKAKDAEIVALKKQVDDSKLSPQKIADAVREMAEVTMKARAVLGDALVVDGKYAIDLKRQVVDAKLGDQAKGWDDNQVNAAFISFTAGVKVGDTATKPYAPVFDMSRDFALASQGNAGSVTDADKAYTEMCKGLQDSYKNLPPKTN